MDGNYIITANGGFDDVSDLYHWGIKGMKWGVRRYQNADGSLTAAGRRRYTNKDGSLNEKGKKYYAKERARLIEERKAIDNLKKTNNQMSILEAQRRNNERLKREAETGKKKEQKENSSSSESSDKDRNEEQIRVSDLSTKELKARNDRLDAEANFKQKMEKIGYTFYEGPKTEADYKIEALKKQKEILTLQKEIKDLTPKKVSMGKKIMEDLLTKAVIPGLSEFAKERGKSLAQDLADEAKKKIKEKEEKEKKKQADKAAKEAADKAAKEAAAKKAYDDEMMKKYNDPYNDPEYKDRPSVAPSSPYRSSSTERTYTNPNEPRGLSILGTSSKTSSNSKASGSGQGAKADTEARTGTVEGAGTSSSKYASGSSSKSSSSKRIIDLDARRSDGTYYYKAAESFGKTVSELTSNPNTAVGAAYVTKYLTSAIAGYLPAPKDRDD